LLEIIACGAVSTSTARSVHLGASSLTLGAVRQDASIVAMLATIARTPYAGCRMPQLMTTILAFQCS
jgi:hypothetical protein